MTTAADTAAATARVLVAFADVMENVPEPVAALLDEHRRNGYGSSDPCLDASCLVSDAALYSDDDPAAVLYIRTDGTAYVFLDGSPEDAEHGARRATREGNRSAWWCALFAEYPEWVEVNR